MEESFQIKKMRFLASNSSMADTADPGRRILLDESDPLLEEDEGLNAEADLVPVSIVDLEPECEMTLPPPSVCCVLVNP